MAIQLPGTETLLPKPHTLREEYPLLPEQRALIASWRQQIASILSGKDPRILIVCGPCSIHHTGSAIRYAKRLKTLASQFAEYALFVMRTYVEKARTRDGWTGMVYDPRLDGSLDMCQGLKQTRKLLLDLAHLAVPTAAEFVDPNLAPYYSDLISWGCIGARTVSSQPHRQFVSSLSLPIGLKNTTDGNVQIAIDGVVVSQMPQCYITLDPEQGIVQQHSSGNPHSHIVLRGSETKSHATEETLDKVFSLLSAHTLSPFVLIDCSHGNSQKIPERQKDVFNFCIDQLEKGQSGIRGVLIESHLKGGSQSIHATPLDPDLSVTDSCLSWEKTEQILVQGLSRLQKNQAICASAL